MLTENFHLFLLLRCPNSALVRCAATELVVTILVVVAPVVAVVDEVAFLAATVLEGGHSHEVARNAGAWEISTMQMMRNKHGGNQSIVVVEPSL